MVVPDRVSPRSKTHRLSDDAKAFNSEARRRVKLNRDKNFAVGNGDHIQIIGEDINGKTDDLTSIVRKVDSRFSTINGKSSTSSLRFYWRLWMPRMTKNWKSA